MNSDNIARLSRKLLASCLVEEGSVYLCSSSYRKDISLLQDPLRDTVLQFLEEMRSQIPSDFSFILSFNFNGVNLSVEFEDGNTGAFGPTFYFTSFKSLRRHLRRQKWDELRLAGIEDGGIFDAWVSEAEDRPVDIPSSEAAAKQNAGELAEALTAIRAAQPLPLFAIVIARRDLGLATEHLRDREETVHIIADRMTTGNDILAVLERGVCWSFAEIEAAKLEAVEQLGPISRAQAERRFLV